MRYGPTVVKVPMGRTADDELGVSYSPRDSRDLWQQVVSSAPPSSAAVVEQERSLRLADRPGRCIRRPK
jgi:hypothetical protein